MSARGYDLAIVGAGSAGLIAADFARRLGARVILIERDRIGGDCTWTGCVPSKALLRVARAGHEARTAGRFGLDVALRRVDMPAVRAYVRSAIDEIAAGTSPEVLRSRGVEVAFGAARFIGPRALAVGDRELRAKRILIATGAQPVIPPLAGLADVPYRTYLDVFDLEQLPATMTIVGGGPIGTELAQAFQRLGTAVTLFAEQLLPKEDPAASSVVRAALVREGVRIVAERATKVALHSARIVTTALTGTAEGDVLLVAAGDVASGLQYSHLAGWQGYYAARNALLPGGGSTASALPRVTFTDPEVAHVGETERSAGASGRRVRVATWPITREDRAICDDDRDGLMKIVTDRHGRVLGATIVGARAGEAIVELTSAVQNGWTVGRLASVIHPYPTYASGLQLLATDIALGNAFSGVRALLLRGLMRLTLR